MPPALMATKDEGLSELKKKEPWRITKEDFDKLKARARKGEDIGIEEIRSYFWTPPYDPRFPNTNQTRNCYQNYLDYHRCLKAKGEKYEPCYYFKRVYEELCPSDWHEHWDEQRANGTFAGNI